VARDLGLLDAIQIDLLLSRQKECQPRIGDLLVEQGALTEGELPTLLAHHRRPRYRPDPGRTGAARSAGTLAAMHTARRPLFSAVAVALLLSGCLGNPPERARAPMLQSAVELHVLLPLSGAHAQRGLIQSDVVELATMRLNESRGPLDRPLRAMIHDCGSTSEESLVLAQALIAAGVQAFVGPHSSPSAAGLEDLLDLPGTLVVLPDARDLPPDFGGPSTVALLPPDAVRGIAMVNAALAHAESEGTSPTRVSLAKPPDAAASGAAEAALQHALARGLTLDAAGGLRILQVSGETPHDLVVEVAGASFLARRAVRRWTDPGLDQAALSNREAEATAATYDAVVALGRALRRAPDAAAPILRAAVVDESWEGMLGPTRFTRGPGSRAWIGHPYRLEAP
jgi:ABC-type branched-subunit amino acid transport system substrate-binding protein